MFNTWHQIQGANISQGLQLLLHVAFSTSKLPFLVFRVILSSRGTLVSEYFRRCCHSMYPNQLDYVSAPAINPQRNTMFVIGNLIEISDCGIYWCPIGFIPE